MRNTYSSLIVVWRSKINVFIFAGIITMQLINIHQVS